MKKLAAFTVLLLLLFSCVTAYAAEPRTISVRPSLSFSGTTATCKVSIISSGHIDATLSLWQGSTLIGEWSDSGDSILSISGTCAVSYGKNYKLTVSGTANGESISGSTSKYCG